MEAGLTPRITGHTDHELIPRGVPMRVQVLMRSLGLSDTSDVITY